MNPIILTCLGLLCFVHYGQSALWFNSDSSDPAHPGKCVSNLGSEQIIMNPGEIITHRKSCVRISCSNPGYYMEFASCGPTALPKECHKIEKDETKDYPDCCPRVVCPEQNSINSD